MQTDAQTKVADELRAFIQKEFNVPVDDPEFNDDSHLFDYGYVDSFGAVRLTDFVKAAFSVTITESDLIAHPLNTIREISSFVIQRKNGLI